MKARGLTVNEKQRYTQLTETQKTIIQQTMLEFLRYTVYHFRHGSLFSPVFQQFILSIVLLHYMICLQVSKVLFYLVSHPLSISQYKSIQRPQYKIPLDKLLH